MRGAKNGGEANARQLIQTLYLLFTGHHMTMDPVTQSGCPLNCHCVNVRVQL
jgi:hypothetical protein